MEIKKGSDLTTILWTTAFILVVFLCVVLHEIGHSLAARKYGIQTKRITLLPIGGVASLERIPEEPRQELWIAVAGPLVNIALTAVVLLLAVVFPIIIEAEFSSGITPQNFLFSLMVVNIFLVLFNAIPAFPMDGGRVLRALISMKAGRVKATQIAAVLGQLFALGFVILGFFYNPFMIFIGLFVFFGAYSENMMVQQMETMRGYLVKDAMMTQLAIVSPGDTVRVAIEKLIAGQESNFIVVDQDQVVGVVLKVNLLTAVKNNELESPIQGIMNHDFGTIAPSDKLSKAYNILLQPGRQFIPVIENGILVGALDMENINEFLHLQSALN